MRLRLFRARALLLALTLASFPGAATAQTTRRVVELSFVPAGRAQIAIWIETAAGEFMDTVRLTQSAAYRGIGNRPGASQMNGGFRWPYGRREGLLPVWAHRRASAPLAQPFPFVIFQDRTSEGFASRTTADFSRDDYFCLSFNAATTRQNALDAVSCASVFNSDKGRYLLDSDVSAGYAEPYQDADGSHRMRALPIGSLYPPRRDVTRCTSGACVDHPDVDRFAADARRVMPNIDAVTMATPVGDATKRIRFDLPDAWPSGDYVAWLEIHVDGDYNGRFNSTTLPTPTGPTGAWDFWAESYGYAFRGQPSVVYGTPFHSNVPVTTATAEPVGYGDLHGETATLTPMDGALSDDPIGQPGSGADRLGHMADGSRLRVQVITTEVCDQPMPPPECGMGCDAATPCPAGFLCAPDFSCVGVCDLPMTPGPVANLVVEPHPNIKRSHEWAVLRFAAPDSGRPLADYEVRVSSGPIVDETSFLRAVPANAASLDSVELVIATDAAPGDEVSAEFGGLLPESRFHVAVRAVDMCNAAGPIRVASVETTEIHFTTVSPCFVATAAYGTPLAGEIGALRRFRDRHLMSHGPGRAVVRLYHRIGPGAADLIRNRPWLRALTRVALSPLVTAATWFDSDAP